MATACRGWRQSRAARYSASRLAKDRGHIKGMGGGGQGHTRTAVCRGTFPVLSLASCGALTASSSRMISACWHAAAM